MDCDYFPTNLILSITIHLIKYVKYADVLHLSYTMNNNVLLWKKEI